NVVDSDRAIAAMNHGPWTMIYAPGNLGKRTTSCPSLQTDLRKAGAMCVEYQSVSEHGVVTWRKTDDIRAFCRKMIEEFCEGRHGGHRHAAE
ncbi:DJ-1/PfpI family protein, partial [Azospirillum sp. B506]|uniref:DJ-1/PfpI family protein n=1 Tax=Azospirillum sp. B506 TaxID=137721 RepID=UPI001900C542